ncbi:uncharacterized protein LOC126816350 isoform X1 [Patella vulgata]|uniref:uncharacterized protein LOC126816350 isoform X1 n=2 Tax=Patella vulgata TaxID=6465 RepID=UPI0021803F64|nr:uncharacterized protein LOC126816350 isoform X1 [Patella vulgata]
MGVCASQQSTATSPKYGQAYPKATYPQQQTQPQHPPQPQPQPQPQHQQHTTHNQSQVNQRTQPTAPPLEERTPPEGQNAQSRPQQDPNMEKHSPEATLNMLKRYIELEGTIRPLESKNVIGTFAIKKEGVSDIDKSLTQIEGHYKAACDKVAKEKADVDNMQAPSTKAFFKDQTSFDAKLSKEQEEYLEAVNEQEVVKNQLDSMKSQKAAIQKEIDSLSKEVDELNKYYEEQDDLLDKIFSGEYGSDLENKLEVEVDQLRNRKERVAVAKYKWDNSKVLLQHACTQLAFTVRRWLEIPKVQANNVQAKYHMATECRNNVIAASQNISSAHRYLQNIKFPYCEQSELDTLNKACNNIYIDMQSTDRHQHAFQCYSVTHKRAAALLQWFNNVIEGTINKDLKQVQESYSTKASALRQERLRLIKEKMGGNVSDLGITDGDLDKVFGQRDDTKQAGFKADETAFAKPEEVKGDDGQPPSLSTEESGSTGAPTPLPLDELAPAPSTDELFGNIEQLKKQHEQELKEFEKAQEINKARMEQGLQEKLRQRRNRRQRTEEN